MGVAVQHYLLMQVRIGQLIVVFVRRVFMDKIVIQVNRKKTVKKSWRKILNYFSN
jgi:hypothetical protein